MTEPDWFACSTPVPMLEFLRGRATDRRLRLFACACCRFVWNHHWTTSSRQAVAVAERYADDQANDEDLEVIRELVRGQLELYGNEPVYDPTYWACSRDISEDAGVCAGCCQGCSTLSLDRNTADFERLADDVEKCERFRQSLILRDIFGNPFHLPTVGESWRSSTVLNLAQAIYDERRFTDLPILGDALLDAGCDNEDILTHCRSEGPHVRGCWVVDLLLAKQ